MGPSQAAVSQFADEKWLRAQFPRPIVIAVADPKGGAGKTPTTVGLAAAFGLARGSGVIAWDNNELRGTLADRTFSAHRNTVVDMLIRAESLLRPDTRVADVQAMLNYQSTGQFWVLGSSQEAGQAISGEQFATVREILSRFFSVIIIDTGNNEVAPNWVETVINADVLVVPVKWRKDNIVPAARMIETLTEQSRDIINRIVVVGTNGPGELMPTIQTSVADWFKPSPIIEIPTDPHIAEGAEIDWNQLQPATRRAYQSLGATVAKTVSAYLRGGQ
jgi:MinD-like ATPase involved in chromosome partitioning or flagellar assembly